MRLRLLRLFLGLAALTWGAAGVGIFLSWDTAVQALQGLGARAVPHDPMLDYWLRMASGAFGLIGVLYLVCAIHPGRFQTIIPWLGGFMLMEGAILIVHGLRLSLPPFPFYGDILACCIGGGAILYLSPAARPGTRNRSSNPPTT